MGRNLSGVGVYSRELLAGLAVAHPEARYLYCFRPHRLARARELAGVTLLAVRPLTDWIGPRGAHLFHGLNQRLPERIRFRRAVATFHDLFVMTGEYSTKEFRDRFSRQAREAARRADLVIAVSAFTAGQVHELLGVEKNRIRVVPHGVHPPDHVPDDAARENLVLHVGALQKRKNVSRLVEAFERMPDDWRLVLAGGSGYGIEEIFARIERSPARGRIEIAGYVPPEALERLYRRARIFAFPSLDEGFGIPILEAMTHGLPVVASSRPALEEAGGGAALLVNPLDTDELAGALCRLAREPELRAELIRRGRTHAAARTWANAVERTWLVYRELAALEPAGRELAGA